MPLWQSGLENYREAFQASFSFSFSPGRCPGLLSHCTFGANKWAPPVELKTPSRPGLAPRGSDDLALALTDRRSIPSVPTSGTDTEAKGQSIPVSET